MPVNQKMFAEIHKLITEFPELHDQTAWETDPRSTELCGTTRCVAGWATWIAARNAGMLTRKRQMTGVTVRQELADYLGLVEGELDHLEYQGDYLVSAWPVLGATALGLSDDQAHSLFHDMHRERVVARVKSYADTGEDISADEYERFDD